MDREPAVGDLERRKQLRLRLRADLAIAPQKYEGRTFYVVKDPVSLRYFRFKEREHFLLQLMDGRHTLNDARLEYEKSFRPERLTLENLEGFARRLLTAGLAHNTSPSAGKQLWERRRNTQRRKWLQLVMNFLCIKIPLFDPDWILGKMIPWVRWIFSTGCFLASMTLMGAALLLVATHFETFRQKLPSYQVFFSFTTAIYLWIALALVKVIHEFGHGLSCKLYGGEVHEMGFMLLCLSPCLYCNVTDAWTLPNKWKRIVISSAGIYVELIIAALATFTWWNTPSQPFLNNLSLCLMVVCSISTLVFNANPLLRYDGYYVLSDWLEVPNLRDRSNRLVQRQVLSHCLGVKVNPEPYLPHWRHGLFLTYAVAAYVYRWVVTFSIIYFLCMFLKPYKLDALGSMLAGATGALMVGRPLFQLGKNIYQRGRLPGMKAWRVVVSAGAVAGALLFVAQVPLPVSRVRQTALVQLPAEALVQVFVPSPAILERLYVREGQHVEQDDILAEFRSLDLETSLEEDRSQRDIRAVYLRAMREYANALTEPQDQAKIEVSIARTAAERDLYAHQADIHDKMIRRLVLRAPRAGVVLGSPKIDAVGKRWEKNQTKAFCSIGTPGPLRALLPLSPADFHLLKEERENNPELTATIRLPGHGGQCWKGKVAPLPEAEAQTVPLQLTTRGGGPLAARSSSQPDIYVPMSQQYLVAVDFLENDPTLYPGTLAEVKVDCRWHSCAWWLWRKVAATFDLGLI